MASASTTLCRRVTSIYRAANWLHLTDCLSPCLLPCPGSGDLTTSKGPFQIPRTLGCARLFDTWGKPLCCWPRRGSGKVGTSLASTSKPDLTTASNLLVRASHIFSRRDASSYGQLGSDIAESALHRGKLVAKPVSQRPPLQGAKAILSFQFLRWVPERGEFGKGPKLGELVRDIHSHRDILSNVIDFAGGLLNTAETSLVSWIPATLEFRLLYAGDDSIELL